jgi:hypothetical protein
VSARDAADLIWKTPPSARRGRRPDDVYDRMVEKLKGRPGKWALVAEKVKSPNGTAVWKRRGCQTQSRIRPDGGYDIYARWGAAL